MDSESLPSGLEKPLIKKALEELKMLTQTDLERERYEARRKAQLDHDSMINAARREGQQEGRQEGLKEAQIVYIETFERMLGRAETPAAELRARAVEELAQIAEDLLSKLPK
jgi:predicted transposase/invertase (TIGR01784 family)